MNSHFYQVLRGRRMALAFNRSTDMPIIKGFANQPVKQFYVNESVRNRTAGVRNCTFIYYFLPILPSIPVMRLMHVCRRV